MVPFSFRSVFSLLILTGTLSLLTCIEQDNPWDPINGCHPDDINFFSNEYNSQLQKVLDRRDTINATFASDTTAFTSLQNDNDSIRSNNTTVTAKIKEKLSESQESHLRNIATGDCETATLRDSIRLQLQRLDPEVSTNNITQAITMRSADSSRIATIFRETEGLCGDLQIFTATHRQSILQNYATPVDWITKKETVTRYSAATVDSNRVVDSINEVVRLYNSLVKPYNDSLNDCKIARVTNSDTIQTQLDSIQPGDTVALGEGAIIGIQINLVDRGSNDDSMTILGVPGGKTIIETSPRLYLKKVRSITFKHLVFKRTLSIQVQESNKVHFYSCSFNGNPNHGVEASYSSNLRFENCQFLNNCTVDTDTSDTTSDRWSALRLQECTNVRLDNILIARTSGYGIEIDGATALINKVTITDNIFDGILYKNSNTERQCFISNSIFSYNGGYGIFCLNENSALSASEANENRFFQNSAGPMGGNEAAIESNGPFTAQIDPMYTDTIDYQIGPESPLYNTGIGYNKTP